LEAREVLRVNSLLNTICGKAQPLSNISKEERGESTHRGGYTSKSEERRIWWAGRHDWTKVVGGCQDEFAVPTAASGREARITGLGSTQTLALNHLPRPT